MKAARTALDDALAHVTVADADVEMTGRAFRIHSPGL